MVTHRLQVERRTGKFAGVKTDVLPLSYSATENPVLYVALSILAIFSHVSLNFELILTYELDPDWVKMNYTTPNI